MSEEKNMEVTDRKYEIKLTDLPQYLGCENKDQDKDLKCRRQLHFKRNLHKTWHDQQDQRQCTEKHILIVPVQQLKKQHHDHKDAECEIHNKGTFVLAKLHIQCFAQIPHTAARTLFIFSIFIVILPYIIAFLILSIHITILLHRLKRIVYSITIPAKMVNS